MQSPTAFSVIIQGMQGLLSKPTAAYAMVCLLSLSFLVSLSCRQSCAFNLSLPIPVPGVSSQNQDPKTALFYRLNKEAYEDLQTQNYQAAANKLRQALSLDASHANTHLNLGYCYLYMKRPLEAIPEFRQSISLDSNQPSAYLDLVGAYVDSNQLNSAVGCGQEFMRRFPHSREAANMMEEIRSAQEQLNKRTDARTSDLGAPSANDYLALACDEGARRWSLSRMPLKVYMQPGHGVAKYQKEFGDAVSNAFRQWQLASGGNVRFEQVEDPTTSDINVEWTADADHLMKRIELGEARCDRMDGFNMGHVTIVVLTRNRNLHEDISPQTIYLTALHEIGHAIGLHGHSDNTNDIMFYSETKKSQSISMRDVMTLQKLYMLPEQTVIASMMEHGAITVTSSGPSALQLDPQQQQMQQQMQFPQQQQMQFPQQQQMQYPQQQMPQPGQAFSMQNYSQQYPTPNMSQFPVQQNQSPSYGAFNQYPQPQQQSGYPNQYYGYSQPQPNQP